MSDPATTPVLIGGARTPFARFNGAFASLQSAELGAHAIRAALDRTGVPAAAIDAVIVGQVIQAGAGQGPARQASIGAGLGWDVPTVTVNKLCLSGLTAIIDAARLIRTGEAQVVVAGGQESMSNAPHLLLGSRRAAPLGDRALVDSLNHDGLVDPFDRLLMGTATDRGNVTRGIPRERQDAFAALSHSRAAAAQDAEILAEEIVPLSVPQRRGGPVLVAADDGIRRDTTIETLARLRPAFAEGGNVTAGSSSQLTDGAAMVVVASKAWALAAGIPWLAEIGAAGQVAGPDGSLHSQPSRAIAQALRRQSLAVGDLDVIEINEAFASVVLQSADDLGVSPEAINTEGGAIALGHPVGASGARLALHTALALRRRGGGRSVAALCGGGGQGEALILFC
ncbi:acetyl-CoA C-acyltransferase [Cryobacterium sp. TMT1-21]|uniref:Probable acetyl-CoA acetyltransferase n=1 Tax=Cryobacterium shii TaxID=1259235 RepID=A0AAQ2HE85_9MICO|nr:MULTISPECIES: acetyl-CoA C-acyltransferase [Cryobacterium]TFC40954.1 acetyl-CoA C-acyltransferase [Cryobacterium shii]TFC87813.1 acetyl-CoA C-acyltransferase [Cryobacterium sp. TmT2-59]TFD12431.1 acetyl-CoA C-acyltransferase [Cryobacterium sp. TMT1-21]TFD19371.1 acetyl-CoA C-acyltransferase [Cryobacterium sp. TMT2-23]TFD19873.1 acetyl-CoA C-acyltransferase [Cryobacterium sp. TMT4-10]